MAKTQFTADDRVRHAGKPEWGTGVVLSAQNASHNGASCQRLVVRFDQAGRKTVSTAYADIRPLEHPSSPDKAQDAPPARRSRPTPPVQAAQADSTPSPDLTRAKLTALPDEVSDPFRPLDERLRGTLSLYRFEPAGRGLLDWASIQTGLQDSMSVLNRHELEQQFETFRLGLDRHLKSLLDECRRVRLDTAPLLGAAPPAAQHALRRINHPR